MDAFIVIFVQIFIGPNGPADDDADPELKFALQGFLDLTGIAIDFIFVFFLVNGKDGNLFFV
jgi:hypothetical protein